MTALAGRLRRLFPDSGRRKMIWSIALPIMGGMMSQNILNLVDIGMVGRLGDSALAATGIGSFSSYLAISFIIGLSAGVQALAARRLGEGRTSETAIPLNGGLILALVIGIPLCVILILFTPTAFTYLTSDPAVQELGIPYLQIRIAAMMAVGMNFSFRGYWSAIHMTSVYLRTLLIMHAINIFLNWVLIFGNLGAPELGVFGAGLATTISLYIGTSIYFFFALRHASHITAILPAFGIALAATTLVGNALGRGDADDAALWGWNCSMLTFLYGVVMSVLLIPLASPILAVFLTNPETRQLAYLPMILWALMIAFDTMGMVLMNALIGAGDTRRSMWISLIWQWAFFLPLAFLAGPVLGFGLLGVWIINGIYRVGQALNCAHQWKSRKWARIQI
jgi:Na+-driven multidrug efflux pump